DAHAQALLSAAWNSFVVDFTARQKHNGTDLGFFIARQIPIIHRTAFEQEAKLLLESIVLELSFTAWHLVAFAQDLGYTGTPFRWDANRRTQLRAELDALMFRLYGIARADVEYILNTFPIVKR